MSSTPSLMGPAPASLDEIIAQMLELQKALPKRPSFPELDIATATISKVDEELAATRTELSRHPKPLDASEAVFNAFQEMSLEAVEHRALERKKDVKMIVELEERYRKYDKWIRKVHAAISPGAAMDAETDADADTDLTNAASGEGASENVEESDARGSARSVLDATWEFPPSEGSVSSFVGVDGDGLKPVSPKSSAHQRSDSFSRVSQSLSWNKEQAKPVKSAGELSTRNSTLSTATIDEERRDASHSSVADTILKTADALNLPELASVQRQTSLDLRGALLKDIEWVPESIGKMTWLLKLNLSRNRLTALPDSVGALVSLEHMDVSLNQLTVLPETIGQLVCLKSLILDNNKIEELPYSIGQCTSLSELTASFNQLKALPEATGKLIELHSLDVHFNKLGSLPTTMASMASLVDLDASFNEIHHVPEGLCQVTTLTRINLSSNFNELQELPVNIGNLQKLKMLNLSCNQLRVLPDSVAMLTNLQDLDLSGNPLRVPPRHIADQWTEAILKYMAEYILDKEKSKVVVRRKSFWSSLFSSCAKPSVIETDFAPR